MKALELRNVSKRFKDGRGTRSVLDSVDLSVEHGELVALMGPSGSGKSTLLAICAGLVRPDDGSVLVAGDEIAKATTRQSASLRRNTVGYIEQNRNLLSALTVLDNVGLPLEMGGMSRRASREAARESLVRAGIETLQNVFPDDLSGGEQQRVSIARALVGTRQILVADEPTGSLDSVTGETTMSLLRSMCDDGAAVLMATHDRSHAAWADRVLQIRDASIVGQRTSADLDVSHGSAADPTQRPNPVSEPMKP